MSNRMRAALLLAGIALLTSGAVPAATTVIVNNDPPSIGFNDPTPAVPVGGNTGTTLGAQRLIVVQAAANQWAATLQSAVPIRIQAQWVALTCTSSSGTLASGRTIEVFANFGSGANPGYWYGKALANALSGLDHDPTMPDITISFNVNVGKMGCLDGTFFYLGLDNNHGASLDLLTLTLHELAHGLGFATFTDASTGAECCGGTALPAIYDAFLLDTTTGKKWPLMSNAERMASAVNTDKLVWSGANVVGAVPGVLQLGSPSLIVTAPASVAGKYLVGTASFGPALSSPGVTGEVAQMVDSPGNIGLACTALSPANAAAVNGKIALIDRGTCTFVIKAENVQAAGAIGIVVVDNVAGSPPGALGGTDPTVTIPIVRVTMADGATLKTALATLPPGGMVATIGLDLTARAGADSASRPFVYTPNPFVSGSSVSHWDASATPDQLMEPFLYGDLKHAVMPPDDLTLPLLMDLGWSAQAVSNNYQGLWWAAPAGSESGWGINFAHQGDTIFASWFTYDLTGAGDWLVMTAPKIAPNTYSGTLYATSGPPFNAMPFNPNQVVATPVGVATLTFTDANDGSFAYTIGATSQMKVITREVFVFGTLPTCATATGSLASATNYTDLWWATPPGSESGWGINLTHEGDKIFASWFTYDLTGTAMWLVVTAPNIGAGVYSGTLYQTTGPPFNSVPFNPNNVVATAVGSATFTFSDGNNATFAYTVNGISQAKAITREIFQLPGTVCQ